TRSREANSGRACERARGTCRGAVALKLSWRDHARLFFLPDKQEVQLATSLLALIDDIATVLDDVSVMTKVAAKKTAGVLGDDLALNAQQVSGVKADRELPVVWAVCKGSLKNKLILVPAALL